MLQNSIELNFYNQTINFFSCSGLLYKVAHTLRKAFVSIKYLELEITTWCFHIHQPTLMFKILNLLLGSPGMPVIFVNVTEVETSKYKIMWQTPTFSNILEHSIIYKQVKVNIKNRLSY